MQSRYVFTRARRAQTLARAGMGTAGQTGAGIGVAMAILCAAPAAIAAPDYGAAGAHQVETSDLPSNMGGASGGKLVVPKEAGTYPLIIASHGWSASADNQVGWAQHFASWGFVVVAPTFPNSFTPDANVDKGIIEALVKAYATPPSDSPASGKVDATRIGLEGHSAGGLATTLAAVDLKPQATVLFDPVDKSDAGKAAFATVCSPVLGIFANGSSCNNNAGWSAFKDTSAGPAVLFNVVNSTHCDGENADRGVACGLVCGGSADPARQAIYGRYATAYLLANLKGDVDAQAALAETALDGDAKITGVKVRSAPSCAAPIPGGPAAGGPGVSDGGIAGGGSGGSGGGGSSGSGDGSGAGGGSGGGGSGGGSGGATTGRADGGNADQPGVDVAQSSGCACGAARTTGGGAPIALGGVAVAIAAILRGRRRRR